MASLHELRVTPGMTIPEYAYTIAIVEAESILRQGLIVQLKNLGFSVKAFENAMQLYRFLAIRPETIVVLDIDLPGEDGFAICKYLRDHDHNIGIVFMAAREQRNERLTGLAAGADAYLIKPIDMDELTLILKRLALRLSTQKRKTDLCEPIAPHGWYIGKNSILLVTPNTIRIKVSYNEAQLLRTLLQKPGATCVHSALGMAIGLNPDELEKHRIEVILSRLCAKVKRTCGLKLPIQSLRGVGYALLCDENRA
jgi:DNA-binding response OmpR family regulator